MFEGTIYLKAIPPWQGKLECQCFYVGLDGFDLSHIFSLCQFFLPVDQLGA